MAQSARGAQADNYRTARVVSPGALPLPDAPLDTQTAPPARAPSRTRPKKSSASPLATLEFSAAVLAALFVGWQMRGELYIVPGTGIGYWIGIVGIVGSLMMLSLLLDPLRKKFAKVASLGTMHTWFKVHMITGILGPLLIILHSNFELKTVNATLATAVMLTVVASGMTGRFLYSKIHKGLYGAKAELKGHLSEAEAFKQAFGDNMQAVPETMAGALQHLDLYNATIRKAAGLKFYSRLFGWWHILHLPLFFLLIIVTIGHIVAVHLY